MENRIRQLREELHMTQIRLSIELEVAQETVSAYESGRHYPSIPILVKMSELFHASCDYILGLSSIRMSQGTVTEYTTSEEQRILNIYRNLPIHKQELFQAYLDGLIDA